MSYVLKLHGVIIGRSELEERDSDTRTAAGEFRKSAGYELVEPIFALRSGADAARYRRARDTLSLQLFDAAGTMIETGAIDIEPGATKEALRLRVSVPDPGFWR